MGPETVLRRRIQPLEKLEGYEQLKLVDVIFRKTEAYEPEGASSVLDFGGGSGSHCKQVQSLLVRWVVVEMPAMIER
ncbi:hypothetical protein KMZ93_08910 [Bradyrhizobium sediminis]|uniref:O-methyltransferase domain-containing protein n=1 Tax=Bradyrhizobium sediminis TaxID=2840469 RepID=A0A975P0R1_9BRAD|nr:hypothetical protein [Bradyrhizobium sediminis]QWG24977.1 hypothetical protein KMZ93_08910 [Bradyrhizobium sediminis]